MNLDELNEIATLLHVTSEIATNHPSLYIISRACQRRLSEISAELSAIEAQQIADQKQAEAEKAAAEHKPTEEPLREGDDLLDQPVETLPDNSGVTVERRV